METGAHVWLRSPLSKWGWVPALISSKEESVVRGRIVVKITCVDDCGRCGGGNMGEEFGEYFADLPPFEEVITLDGESLKNADHEDVKLRNLPKDTATASAGGGSGSNVHDLIQLTHLHEPAILHSLRLRYNENTIYTATGPILIAINPFKRMGELYGEGIMERYRILGEGVSSTTIARAPRNAPLTTGKQPEYKRFGDSGSTNSLYTKALKKSDYAKKLWGNESNKPLNTIQQNNKETTHNPQQKGRQSDKLPPHPYKTADDAYRAMMRGLENGVLMAGKNGRNQESANLIPTNQSILVSGESGAGKTVTTKIVLNYFAMLSKQIKCTYSEELTRRRQSFSPIKAGEREEVCIEQQVLQSNPILEAFGNARTLRNDNSSRFGKYIDIQFTNKGKLSGAQIETYLLEKVRLIHPSEGERNYHVFYQFLARASTQERRAYMLDEKTIMSPRHSTGFRGINKIGVEDFKLLNQTGTYDRRDKVCDGKMHDEMLDAMLTIGFEPETINSLMRLVAAILHCGNMTFTSTEHKDFRGHSDGCHLDKTPSAMAAAKLLGVTFEHFAEALTTRAIRAGNEIVHTPMDMTQSMKACEALMKATYGAAFDFIVDKINESIRSYETEPQAKSSSASIGVLDIFGFETFQTNNFEQICINYTNEALQQQFNKYVFKLEQEEYEREGILWKFISFPDNQEILDLIDKKHTGILAVLDEQCIVPSTDQKFTRFLYDKCEKHPRFIASASQKVHHKFTIQHYAGPVEYSTENWLEKNKDQMPSASVDLLRSANFDLLSQIQQYIRAEREGRGSVATKSVAAQFSSQLRELRSRIDTTVPHYIRCLKPNDELVPDSFDPKMIVDQLRCGGVLEAVRVSRAGYPTRYPHEVFKARYYFLGDREAKSNKAQKTITPFGTKMSMTNGDNSIKKLIGKIAYDIWLAEHGSKEQQDSPAPDEQPREQSQPLPSTTNGRSNFLAARTAFASAPTRANSFRFAKPAPTPTTQRTSSFRESRQNLASTPTTQRPNCPNTINASSPFQADKGRANNFSECKPVFPSVTARANSFRENKVRDTEPQYSEVARPQTSQEFLALDFSTRCAIAGLQLGRTKVFLRREAFDRIEALRARKFGKSAVTIQRIVRGIQVRASLRLSCTSICQKQNGKMLRDHVGGSFSNYRDEYMRMASSVSVDSRNDSENAEPGTMELRTLKSVEGKFQVWPPLKSNCV